MFIKPTDGQITNGFRAENRDHNGIDWAASGTVEIVAATSGTVSKSYTSESYGETVFIVHRIGGQTYETVYAHMRSGSRKVSVGDVVEQGQIVGYMGATGDATGQHLHFEVHIGRWNVNKTNAVNPLNYINENTENGNTGLLKQGDRGPAVRQMQEDLASVYFYPNKDAKNHGIDGIFGPKTENAVIRFQSMYGLLEDGVYGPKTRAKLREVMDGASQNNKTLVLPAQAESWRVYPLDVKPVKGNEKGLLNPKKFNGLEYKILGNPQSHVYIIQTVDFGKVQIYAHPDTGASFQ